VKLHRREHSSPEKTPEVEIKTPESAENGTSVGEAASAVEIEIETPETPVEALERQLAAAQAEIADAKDKHLRAVAEFDNFRRRTAQQYAEMNLRAGERILTALLDPVDNLSRALTHVNTSEDGGDEVALPAFVEGIGLIHRQLLAVLEKERVTPMETLGTPFDPQLHEALMMVEQADTPANTVVGEVQCGYRLGERVLRHAKVIVSKAPSAPADVNEESQMSSEPPDTAEER
jgi:molecular chaperone GrpE